MGAQLAKWQMGVGQGAQRKVHVVLHTDAQVWHMDALVQTSMEQVGKVARRVAVGG
jgi:hypothetical protein